MRVIKKIEIENFRTSVSVDLADIKDITVFAGANDAGKSNILRALNLFFNNKTSFGEDFDFNLDYSKSSLLSARESAKKRQFIAIKIHLHLEDIETNRDLVNEAKQHQEGLWMQKIWWRGSIFPEVKIPDFVEKKGALKASFTRLINQSFQFVYIPAFKNEEVFSAILRMAGDKGNALISLNDIKVLNDAIGDATDDLSRDFQSLSKVTSKITLPTTLGTFWHSLKINTTYDKNLTQQSILKGDIHEYDIAMANRGEGIKSLFIPVMLNWLAKKQKNKYWIWGIDEPENSLEMARTTDLFDKFYKEYSNNTQIFCSTHSPVFIFPDKDKKEKVVTYLSQAKERNGSNYTILDLENVENRVEIEHLVGFTNFSFLDFQKESAEKLRGMSEQLTEKQEEVKALSDKIFKGTKPLVITEGKTDWKYLKAALSRLGAKYQDIHFDFLEFEDDAGDSVIKNMLEMYSKLSQPRKFIFIFDRDRDNIVHDCDAPAGKKFKDWQNNVFSFCIPKPAHRSFDAVCMEHYFSDEEIKTEDERGRRMFLGTEFDDKTGTSISAPYFVAIEKNKCGKNTVIDSKVSKIENRKVSVALSKNDFALNILHNKSKFNNFNHNNFTLIFDIIKEIITR